MIWQFFEIRKRSGAVTAFNQNKISNAIFRALAATSKADRVLADQLANKVVQKLVEQGFTNSRTPTVEDIQDIVESTLIDCGNSDIAKAYIVYRHSPTQMFERVAILVGVGDILYDECRW